MAIPSSIPPEITFEAPGPGSWALDAVHVPRPFSRFQAEIHPPNVATGFRAGARRYGLLIDTLDWRLINGFAYSVPVPAPEPDIPARFEAAEKAFADKLWRRDLTLWMDQTKPASIEAHRNLLSVDPKILSRDRLLAYLDQCRHHLALMIQQHHAFNAAAFVPVGDFIAHLGEWTGRPLAEFLALTRGSAPESAGSFPELDRLASAIQRDPEARQALGSSSAWGEILKQLRAAPGDVGAAATAYLDIVSYRLLDSLDSGEPMAIEVPEVLVQGIRHAVDSGASASNSLTAEEAERVREQVPAAHRDAFDELLGEVRVMSRLRDERGLYSDVWAGGIMRRALLAAGEKLVDEGRLAKAAHLIEGDYQEIRELISGGGPSGDDLAARANYRATARVADAPPFLGDPPSPPPPLDGLPPAPRRMMQALGTAIEALFAPSTKTSETTVVRGTGASPGVYTGTARVIDGPSEFGRLRSGDVLVTATTTEAFNIVLPLLGGMITNSGGLLSHAAIVSREYGVPCVVGCRDATARIPDGARVRVDGGAGEIQIEAP